MSSKNSTEEKKLRREAKLAKKRTGLITKYVPFVNKYGQLRHSPIKMPAGMFK